ncbi:MarR family winged helix-turn-helix transcriptional regulator [Geodermatophilus telluris]|uniref:MarR family winged helix-turn-helix transcriptional regulator n=1 Tax=Geodermatophilus telluris TaxID=1190417 RepID=UPI000B2B1A81|nr:MarR family transcriptional regulator [Geodermatophilus telluris]
MTSSPALPGAAPPSDRLAELRTLSEQLPRFLRVLHALKAQATEGRERAALVLLFPLVRLGPLRQGALAELVHADPSTVSRHVAVLIEHGLVQRVADETDGRASLLVVTDAGHRSLEQLRAEREAHLARVTADWPPEDVHTLVSLFGRLVDDLAASLPTEPAAVPAAPSPREKS